MGAALLLPATALLAQTELRPRDVSRSQLIWQLRGALDAFDRGTALLQTRPDEAFAAFRLARDKFQMVVDAGIDNGRLYYNLANAHVRLGEIGKAIADYRRADRLIPHDPQLKANLRFARSLTRDQIEPSGERTFLRTVFFWHYSWPLRTRYTGAMVGYGVFWLLLIVRARWPRMKIGYPALVCLGLWVTLGISVASDLPSRTGATEGVLVTETVVVRKGNGQVYDPQFDQPLHAGVEFELVERRDGWLRIRLPDGNQGWVREDEVELF